MRGAHDICKLYCSRSKCSSRLFINTKSPGENVLMPIHPSWSGCSTSATECRSLFLFVWTVQLMIRLVRLGFHVRDAFYLRTYSNKRLREKWYHSNQPTNSASNLSRARIMTYFTGSSFSEIRNWSSVTRHEKIAISIPFCMSTLYSFYTDRTESYNSTYINNLEGINTGVYMWSYSRKKTDCSSKVHVTG